MPVTYAKGPSAATRFPPASQTEPGVASKKKKKKKGKGKAQDGSNPSNHMNHADHDGIDDEEDDLGPVNPAENELNGRRSFDADHGDTSNYSNPQTAPLNAATHGQLPLRMSTTATAQAELLAAANELYKRMETEQMANDANDGEYWKQLPSHIRSFVETTYAHGAALSPNERSKSQAMLALAQTMVDEATSRFPAGGFPPPFDPSLLSDPKFAEKLGMKHGAMNLMREYAEEAYDDYNSENEDDDIDDEQQYEADDSSKKKKKKKKRGTATTMTNGTTPHPNPLPPLIPLAPNPSAAVTRVAPSAAQPRPSSRAAGKQPVYSQPTVPPTRTNRSTSTKSPVPPNPYNHGYPKSAVANGNSTLAKRPTGGGDKEGRSKLWSSSTEQDRERIKEFWLGLSDVERRDLVKLEKEAVLKKMKEQQKHSCSCAVCGRKRNAIEEELEVLYDAYYEELEQYANHQQQYQSSGGKITPPPGPGPFPGSVAYDKNGAVIGGPPGATKHPARGARPVVHGARGRKPPTESDEEYEDEYEDDEDEYEEEEEEEEEEDDDDDPNARKLAARRRDLPPRAPLSRRPNGREDFFNFGNLTTAGPGNILTVADDLLKNDGGKFLEMMEQLAERRMQREEDAAKEVEVDSEEDEDDPEGSEEDEEDDEDNDDESEEEEDDPMSEEQKMEEGRKMFSIFAARMFEQRVLNAYREKVAAERQEQLLRELEDEDKVQAEKDAKRQKENQKKKDKKKQQKQAKEAEKAKKDAEKAREEAAVRAKADALEEEQRKKREEDRLKRELERKQKEEEKSRLAEERKQRIEEQKAIDLQRKKEKEERERKERLARQEKEAQAKAERAERERKAKEERTAREAKEREERERREKDDKERKEKEQAKAEERKRQDSLNAAKVKAGATPTSPHAANYPTSSTAQQTKKPVPIANAKPNGPLPSSQRPVAAPMNRPPQMQQQQTQPILVGQQRPMMSQGQGMPMNIQLPPNMGIPPIGMASPFNSMVSPIAMSPRISYGPPSATGVGHGPFSPLAPFAQGQGQPGMMNGSVVGNMQQYSFDGQSPLMSQSQPANGMPIQPSRPPSTLPSALALPQPKTPATPTSNGIPPIGVSPGGANASAAHIRRASAQANPSPFGAIGKPRGAPSSTVGDDDRGLQPMSPPSPDRVLGSSALVDENDTIVELPKRRGAAGRIDTIGAPAAGGTRWGPRGTSWQAPNGPGPVGMQWSAAPGRPQPNRLDSPFSPT